MPFVTKAHPANPGFMISFWEPEQGAPNPSEDQLALTMAHTASLLGQAYAVEMASKPVASTPAPVPAPAPAPAPAPVARVPVWVWALGALFLMSRA